MDLSTLRGIAELMDEHGLSHVKVEQDGQTYELDRGPDGHAAPPPPVVVLPAPGAPGMPAGAPTPLAAPGVPASAPAPVAPAAPAAAAARTPAVPAEDDGAFAVEAPMVGVFYVAPAPGAEPFVKIGSKVSKGDTLCIVEAMKCMNEIQAEVDGTIVDICTKDGELVEYGRCLMKIG